jgi:hypothetical protein
MDRLMMRIPGWAIFRTADAVDRAVTITVPHPWGDLFVKRLCH